MAGIIDIMNRARSLRQETALNSITPERAGGIMYDTLDYINQEQLQAASPLVISKIYDSVASMEADDDPVSDLTGKALKPGQVVVIVTGDPDDPDDSVIYRYNGTEEGVSSWTAVGKLGGVAPYLEGYLYVGVATPATDPDTANITQKVYYRATEAGTYTDFDGLVVNDGEVCNLKWNGSAWSKEVTGEATVAQLSALGREVGAQIYERKVPTQSDLSVGRLGTNGQVDTTTSASQDCRVTADLYYAEKGTKIKFTTRLPSGYVAVAIYDVSGTFKSIPLYGGGTSTTVSLEYTFTEDGYYRACVYGSQLSVFSVEILSPETLYDKVQSAVKGEDAKPFLGSIADYISNAGFSNRGCYIDLGLTLQSSGNYQMSNPILVKAGQTIRMNARGTGTSIYLLVAVDSSVPITSVSDVRTFTRIVENFNYDSGNNTLSEFTATEDTYVIAQYYRINNGGFLELGYKPMNTRVSEMDSIQREILEKVHLPESWVKAEVALLTEKLRALSKNKLLVWAFNTDQHISQYVAGARDNDCILRGLRSIPVLTQEYPFDLVVLGGDEVGYSGGPDNTLAGISDSVVQVIKAASTPLCSVVAMAGNHDAYQNIGAANADGYMEFNWKTRGNAARKQLDWAGVRSTNCWIDDSINKVRFVVLDNYSRNQGAELSDCIDAALSDNKLKSSDWQVIIFSHNVVAAVGTNTSDPMDASVWTQISGYISQGVDVVACINGHAHLIGQGVKDDVLMICVPQAMFVSTGITAIHASFDGNIYYNSYESAKETSYDVFAWDRTNNKLHAFQYGAGTDRVFNTTPGSRGIELDVLSGIVSSTGTIAGGTITASNHNTQYSVTLDATGAYSFPYLCPGLDWLIEVELPGGETASQTYNSATGSHTLNITV